MFTYDVTTGTYGEAAPSYQGNLKRNRRKKPNLILDFGDSYFIDSLLRTMHYDEVLGSISYQNKDTLWAMVEYYILSIQDHSHVGTWYDIRWLKDHVCDDPTIIIDSTGLPNAIRMNMTQTSNHYGKIRNEARMVTAIQRDNGYPIMFRAIPGNIVDVTTLAEYGVQTDMSMLDARYVSADNMKSLFEVGIEFIARLPEKNHSMLYLFLICLNAYNL